MNFKIIKDAELIFELKSLAQKEREILSQVLEYLQEVDLRKIHLAREYASLFEFATRELGYTAASAQRRIEAMRLIKSAELSPEAILPREKTCALKDQKTLIQFTADEALMQKLERLKELLSHKQLDNRYDSLFHELADLALDKLEKKITPKLTAKTTIQQPRAKTPAPEMKPRFHKVSRYIPAQVRRAVYQRDAGCCTHRDPITGKICGSRQLLQLDHLKPFAWGGENTLENLSLRCRNHNLYRAEKMGLGFHAPLRKMSSQLEMPEKVSLFFTKKFKKSKLP